MRFLRFLLRLLGSMTSKERIALLILLCVLGISGFLMLRSFYVQSSIEVPKRGGTYIEGSVGQVTGFSPWLHTGNDIDRDIVSLIFSGLMKYDPISKSIVNDLAEVTVTNDQRTYTAVLRPNLHWHDSTEEKPHLVTADDVLFTFQTILEPGFPNPILSQNFRGVELEKLDDRTVRFRLQKPYAFFTSNLTLGLLPKASFQDLSVEDIARDRSFDMQPIGAGPYAFVSTIQTDLSTEVTLKSFDRAGMPQYHIERIVFRVFPDYSSLLTDSLNLDGIRQVPRNESGDPILPSRFTPKSYALPQYVGLFLNLDRIVMQDQKIRLGLQLATNKQEIVDALQETNIIDTGLLELHMNDWQYRFDANAAQGALFDSNWNVPEKVRLQRLLEQREANQVGPLRNTPRIALLQTGSMLTITGSTADLAFPIRINGIRAETGVTLKNGTVRTLSGSWIVHIPSGDGSSGSIKTGLNVLRLMDGNDDIVDSAFVERFERTRDFALASDEYRIVEQFLRTRSLPDSDPAKITVGSMTLENGYLRRRRDNDPVPTRVNSRGESLRIRLLTSPQPTHYATIAEIVQKQWKQVGAEVVIDIPSTRKEFEEKLLKRDYDVVLFGQSMFDNLDSYPYWHSSQIQEQTDDQTKLKLDAFNLSQYASFEADALLTRIRETGNADARTKALKELSELLKRDIPAITLYSPLSVFALSNDVHATELQHLSLHTDRFSTLSEWYMDTDRQFRAGKGWLSLPAWMLRTLLGQSEISDTADQEAKKTDSGQP
ncbi:MAG: ABC transporter substrate-binding protein [Candidatus Peribacteraceae bacterium]